MRVGKASGANDTSDTTEANEAKEKKNGYPAHLMRCTLPDTGFIRLPTLLSLIPISRAALYAGIKANKYPAPVKIAPRTSAWRAEDIKQLIEKLAA